MYFVKSLLLLSAVLCVSCSQRLQVNPDVEFENVAQAFEKILLEVFVPINKIIHVVVFNGENNQALGLLHRMMTNYGSAMTFELEFCYGVVCENNANFTIPSLFILDKWRERAIENDYLRHRKFGIFYIRGATSKRYEEAFDLYQEQLFYNIYLLIDEGDFIYFKVPTRFSEDSCSDLILKTVNRFSKTLQRWELPTFDMESHMKLYGCPLTSKVFAKPPEIYWPMDNTTTPNYTELTGYFIDITNELATRLNFTILVYPREARSTDMNLNGVPINKFNVEYLGSSKTMATINRDIYLLVPLGDYYTGLEKLFLPYDQIGWILIVMTFSIGLIVIQVVNRLLKGARSFVFGRRVSSPTMNLIAVFFGLGLRTMPGRNFARFILMLYIIL